VQAVTVGSGTDSAPGQARNTLAARGATVGILDDVAQKLENEEVWSINPATGLPMVSSAMDIHGNMFGMDNMDSLFNNSNYSNSFNTNFESGIGSQPGGFDSGGSSYGGYGFD
jgi:uncharacterized membrane protein YgcG